MRHIFFGLLISALVSGVCAYAAAQTYADKISMVEAEEAFADEADYAANACGGDFAAKMDWSGFEMDVWGDAAAAGRACDAVLNALQTYCGQGGDAAALSVIVCSPGGGNDVAFANGVLTFEPSSKGASHGALVAELVSVLP